MLLQHPFAVSSNDSNLAADTDTVLPAARRPSLAVPSAAKAAVTVSAAVSGPALDCYISDSLSSPLLSFELTMTLRDVNDDYLACKHFETAWIYIGNSVFVLAVVVLLCVILATFALFDYRQYALAFILTPLLVEVGLLTLQHTLIDGNAAHLLVLFNADLDVAVIAEVGQLSDLRSSVLNLLLAMITNASVLSTVLQSTAVDMLLIVASFAVTAFTNILFSFQRAPLRARTRQGVLRAWKKMVRKYGTALFSVQSSVKQIHDRVEGHRALNAIFGRLHTVPEERFSSNLWIDQSDLEI